VAEPLSLSFALPFEDAIAAAEARGVVLPDDYYAATAAGARRAATTVSGLTALDQVQAVVDSVNAAIASGQAFGEWQKAAEAKSWELPAGRLETVFRTNVQTAYSAGHWTAFQENKARRPFLMWSAINDARVRPTHLAMDGHIAPVDAPIWQVWHPPAGYNCRCSQISLTEAQARARGYGRQAAPTVMPDKGFEGGPVDLQGRLDKAVAKKVADAPSALADALARRKGPSLSPPPKAATIAQAERWALEAVQSDGVADYPLDPRDGGAINRFRHPGARTRADVRTRKFGNAKLTGMKVDAANEVNRWLYEGAAEADTLGIPRLRGLNTAAGRNGATMGDGVLAVNKGNGTWDSGKPVNTWLPGQDAAARPRLASGFFSNERQIEQTFWHEFGHHVHQNYAVETGAQYFAPPLEKKLAQLYAQRRSLGVIPSRYAETNSKEWFAESFSLFKMGRSDLVDPELLKLIRKIYRGEKDFLP
jgi:SPP1 gp7 family putative phage head morphogenesis protein